eukprot:scaffold115422_cov75-Phaeocystis_antarctica.AAC.1
MEPFVASGFGVHGGQGWGRRLNVETACSCAMRCLKEVWKRPYYLLGVSGESTHKKLKVKRRERGATQGRRRGAQIITKANTLAIYFTVLTEET